jgi:hypothetical protein
VCLFAAAVQVSMLVSLCLHRCESCAGLQLGVVMQLSPNICRSAYCSHGSPPLGRIRHSARSRSYRFHELWSLESWSMSTMFTNMQVYNFLSGLP